MKRHATLCLALLFSACGSPGELPEAASGRATLGVQEELRIDGYEADLVPITWMGVSSEGTIAVVQWQDELVRFFDASGEDLGAVGGQGEGPGEFMRPVRAGWIQDTLWVSDTQLGRVVAISPDLEVLRTVRNPEIVRPSPSDSVRYGSYTFASPYAVYGDGSSLVWAIQPTDPENAPCRGGQPPLAGAVADRRAGGRGHPLRRCSALGRGRGASMGRRRRRSGSGKRGPLPNRVRGYVGVGDG